MHILRSISIPRALKKEKKSSQFFKNQRTFLPLTEKSSVGKGLNTNTGVKKGLTVEATNSKAASHQACNGGLLPRLPPSRDTPEILSPVLARISHCFPAQGLRAPVVVPYFATRVRPASSGLSLCPLRALWPQPRRGVGRPPPRQEGRKSW